MLFFIKYWKTMYSEWSRHANNFMPDSYQRGGTCYEETKDF